VIKKPKRASQSHKTPSVPSIQQFNATPRFNFAPSQKSDLSDALHCEQTSLAHQYSAPAQPRDVIEDNLDVIDFDIQQSGEPLKPNSAHDNLTADEDNDFDPRQRSLKRRRLSPSPILDSRDQVHVDHKYNDVDDNLYASNNAFEDPVPSADSIISSPPVEPPQRPSGSTSAPRFKLPSTPAPVPSSTPANTLAATFVKPPRFRPPDGQEHQQRPSEPLPDAFSPKRRGQKFLAGGLAAEVTGWIMNLESSTPVPSTTWSKDDTWMKDLIVDEIRGGPSDGMTLITGRQINLPLNEQESELVDSFAIFKVILAGSGNSEAFQKATKLDVRKKIRIRSPVWEAVIEGEKWDVAVTWEVLN